MVASYQQHISRDIKSPTAMFAKSLPFSLLLFWTLLNNLCGCMELRADMKVDLNILVNDHPTEHSHQSVLDSDGIFTVYWTPDLDKQVVTFELHVRTLGWFGFGFSTNGNMKGADILTAWVEDGQLFLQDRHGIGQSMPPLDDHADWHPLHARENNTHTILVVAREINTCDSQDYALTNETVRMIYAWDERDPADNSGPTYHGKNRGNRFALVLLPFHHTKVTDDVQTWKVRQKMVLPEDKDTFYWCHVEKVPKWQEKHHYIGFDMLYGQNSRAHLHHALVYECATSDGSPTKEIFEKYIGYPGYECYTPNMPPDFYLCEKFLIIWNIGSEGELLPENVGVPMGDLHGGSDFILFQTHYDNKALHQDITVEWGMDLYYTDKLRVEDAGLMALGHSIVFSLTIPPMASYWKVPGHCASQCTQKAIPEDGINVFMVALHAHYLARAIKLRHFRRDVELNPVDVDSFYEADFQQSRRLVKEIKILPGDHLTVECDYESLDRTNGTYSGWGTHDEMCSAAISYYPKIDMSICRSSVLPDVLQDTFGHFGIKNFSSDLDLYKYEFNPEVGDGRLYQDVMNSIPWDKLDKKVLNDKLVQADHTIKCQYNYGQKMEVEDTITRYPTAKPYIPPQDTCSSGRWPLSNNRKDLSYTVLSSSGNYPQDGQQRTALSDAGRSPVTCLSSIVIVGLITLYVYTT